MDHFILLVIKSKLVSIAKKLGTWALALILTLIITPLSGLEALGVAAIIIILLDICKDIKYIYNIRKTIEGLNITFVSSEEELQQVSKKILDKEERTDKE